jgi:hypothetical protein
LFRPSLIAFALHHTAKRRLGTRTNSVSIQCALVHRFVDERTLFPEALRLPNDLDRPVCAAVDAVLAWRHAVRVLMFDRRLHALCARASLESQWLG